MVLHALIRLLHPHHRHTRRLPGRRRRRRLLIASSALATATLAAALADVNSVGRRAPREQRLYHVCVWPTAAACSRAVPPTKPS
jgi:hypothetical protein